MKTAAPASQAAANAAATHAGARPDSRSANGIFHPSSAIAAPTMNGGNAVALTQGHSASGCRPSTHQAAASTSTQPRSHLTAR